MKAPCPNAELEALARGELAPLPARRLLSHVRGCATCRDELAWLRAERRLADEHARGEGPPPPELWRSIEGRLAPAAGARRAARPAYGALLAAAGVALALASWPRARPAPPAAAGHDVVRPEPLPSAPPSVGGAAPAPAPLRTLTASRPVARPATLSLRVGDAAVEVSGCGGGDVSVTVSETRHDALALRAEPGPGGRGERVELRADGGPRLESGRARVSVPRGTRLEVITASGERFVTDVTTSTVSLVNRPAPP
jgi:hypothetical protein